MDLDLIVNLSFLTKNYWNFRFVDEEYLIFSDDDFVFQFVPSDSVPFR